MNNPPIRFLKGSTAHRRRAPFDRSFSYRIQMVGVDIDQLTDAGSATRWLSINSRNLLALHGEDLAIPAGTTWRDHITPHFEAAGMDVKDTQIELITFPRVWLYSFSPLSIWIARKDGAPLGIIYEVHNTFGERHLYAANIAQAGNRHEVDKVFHVSPFWDVSGTYRFRLSETDETLALDIENNRNGSVTHYANIRLRPEPITEGRALRRALFSPLSGLGVTLAIHFQALRLWLRGARYHSRPEKPSEPVTIARSIDQN